MKSVNNNRYKVYIHRFHLKHNNLISIKALNFNKQQINSMLLKYKQLIEYHIYNKLTFSRGTVFPSFTKAMANCDNSSKSDSSMLMNFFFFSSAMWT